MQQRQEEGVAIDTDPRADADFWASRSLQGVTAEATYQKCTRFSGDAAEMRQQASNTTRFSAQYHSLKQTTQMQQTLMHFRRYSPGQLRRLLDCATLTWLWFVLSTLRRRLLRPHITAPDTLFYLSDTS